MRGEKRLWLAGLLALLLLLGGCAGQKGQREYLGIERAREIALADAGVESGEAEAISAELKEKKSSVYYQVEFTADGREYKYRLDAVDGEILLADFEEEKGEEPQAADEGGAPAIQGPGLTEQAAKELVLARTPGATAQDILEFETDGDGARLEYEGKLCFDGIEYEFKIDGITGVVLEWEVTALP